MPGVQAHVAASSTICCCSKCSALIPPTVSSGSSHGATVRIDTVLWEVAEHPQPANYYPGHDCYTTATAPCRLVPRPFWRTEATVFRCAWTEHYAPLGQPLASPPVPQKRSSNSKVILASRGFWWPWWQLEARSAARIRRRARPRHRCPVPRRWLPRRPPSCRPPECGTGRLSSARRQVRVPGARHHPRQDCQRSHG